MKIEVLWEQLLGKGLEHLVLHQNTSIEAQGLIVGVLNDIPYRIQYQIVCDANWIVQKLKILDLLTDKVIALIANGSDWLDENGNSIEAFQGCVDVDIMVTPFTNTLPIQRLNLKQGEAKEISVIYVSIPGLGLSTLKQRYTCINQESGIYRYESLNTGFNSEIKVDENKLVVDYPDIFQLVWKRIEDN